MILRADDSIRESFIAENPYRFPLADLDIVASWQYRVAGNFFVFRHLKKYAVFLQDSPSARAYGVLGLTSPLEQIVGPYLPVLVQAVLSVSCMTADAWRQKRPAAFKT